MKISTCFIMLLATLIVAKLESHGSMYKFEGILGSPSEIIENQNGFAPFFLPYNPTVIDIGSYEGAGTVALAKAYPYGKIFSFEPNPKSFAVLQENVKAYKNIFPVNVAVNSVSGQATLYLHRENYNDHLVEHLSSLLPMVSDTDNASIIVSCVTLDGWCEKNHIDHVDFLRVDAGGLELSILENSPKVLKKAIVIVVKTHFRQSREHEALYPDVKQFLEKNDFEMLAHWYYEGLQGEATFVRKAYYESIFR